MEQHYNVLLKSKKGKWQMYDGTIDGEHTSTKLTEHSWWEKPFVNTICHKLHFNPTVIAWVGNYADSVSMKGIDTKLLYKKAWGGLKGCEVKEAQVSLYNKFLVNHDKKEYLDCNDYFNESVTVDGWCLHPLPLLTAVGNGEGGGDYFGIHQEDIGRWACDRISVENEEPLDGYQKIEVAFVEPNME